MKTRTVKTVQTNYGWVRKSVRCRRASGAAEDGSVVSEGHSWDYLLCKGQKELAQVCCLVELQLR